jgi:predicted secreted protein
MINMKSLKIFLSILMLQVSMQAHSDNDALADLIKGILGAKLIEGIAQEFNNEDASQQNYSSDNRVNTSSGNEGSLGYQYYVLGQKSCKTGDHQKALKWFRESKQQGYVRSVENVYKACSGKSVQYSQSEVESNKGSLGYQYYRIGKKHCKKGETQQAIKWFKESKQQGYKWADRAIDNVYSKCRESTAQALSRDKVCSNGVFAESYVDNECPSITNRWSNNNAKVSSNSKAVTSENITIKAPRYVENAAVVPVTVVFGDRVHSGDKIKLYVNDKLALQVNPKKGSYIDQISTRVILERKSSRIKAKIIRLSGVVETKTSNKISADNSASIPSSSDSDKKHKLKEKDGNIKMLIRNKMGSGKHIWKIKLASSSGEVFVKLSPLLSKDPYFQIKGNHSNAKLVKTLYGSCNKDYSGSTKEPRCLLEQERWYALLNQEIQAEEDQDREIAQEDILNQLKVNYINQISSRVKSHWRYMAAKDGWGCDVHILQDTDGKVQSVNLQSCNIDNNAKITSFKNSIERAVYKSSPLPSAPDQSIFDREILFHFAVNSNSTPVVVEQKNKSSFSDLWGQYGGSILDSNTDSSSNKGNSYSVSDADTQPPVIRFNHSDSMAVNDKKATISGVIKDSSKITELLIKGKEVAIDENGNFSISRYVRLGRNTFDVVALDAFGNKVSKVVTITRNKDIAKNLDKPLDLPSFKGRKDKNAVALIIGLDGYENIARAPWAESDASVFFDYAQQSLGIPADRIALITGDKSDRSGIYDSLDMWLPTMVEEGDSNVYVYFAGHGLATADGEQAYLIPYDGNLENLRRTAIPRKEVISVLKDLKAKSVTLFMDTCYSGTPKGGKGTLVADSRGLRIVKKDNFSSLPKNFTIFSAASNQQTASSHPNLENGLFSYWMMRGLGGEADNNNDRKITNGELHKFINKNVKKAAALMGRKQNSQLVGDANKIIASW